MDNGFIEIIHNQLQQLLLKTSQKFQWFQMRQEGPPQVKILVSEDGKVFSQENKVDNGLIWYKNLNFPSINVTLKSAKPTEFPQTLKSQISAVKLKKNEKPVQSQLIGETEQTFTNGQACFNKLKFTQTSHKCGECLFSLVITIFNDSENASQGEAGLWTIFYSSPFEIEARQRTLPERVAVQKTTNWSLFNPFLPIFLDKQYEAKNKQGATQIIGRDMEGLYLYLRSPIIRHKVFHPIYLLLKFSDSVKLYYNKNLIKIQDNDNLFSKLQRQIFEMLQQNDKLMILEQNKLLILTLKRKDINSPITENEKQIIKYLKSLDSPVVSFMAPNFEFLPKNFTELQYNEKFIKQYRQGFLSMSYIDFKRSKMNEEEQNLLLEFQSNTSQAGNSSSNNIKIKNNQQLYSQTVITFNPQYCMNRQDRIKCKCISLKDLSQNSPSKHQFDKQNILQTSNLCNKRTYQQSIEHTQRDELNINEARQQLDQLRKFVKRNDDQQQKKNSSPSSFQNDMNQNESNQSKIKFSKESQEESQFNSNQQKNKGNKRKIDLNYKQIFNNQKNEPIQDSSFEKGKRYDQENELNQSSSSVFQENKQDSQVHTQSIILQNNTSQVSSQNIISQQEQQQQIIQIPQLAIKPNNNDNKQTNLYPINMIQQQPYIMQMGLPQLQNVQQKQSHPYYPTQYIMYQQPQTSMGNFYYIQNQPQMQQMQNNQLYQDFSQSQQQFIINNSRSQSNIQNN